MKCLWQSEIDSYASRVLAKHWPNIPNLGDINEIEWQQVAPVDVICGGYPCQPFSVAGKQKGEKDDRHLWPEMFRIIKQARPTWVVAENVAGHINMGLDNVLFDLESEGYEARPIVIPACSVNAPHRRDRVWIIANAEGKFSNGGNTHRENRKSSTPKPRSDCSKANVANSEGEQGGGIFKQQLQTNTITGGHGRIKAEEWSTEPRVGRVANGIPCRVDRLRGLGNAIVPQVAYEIIRNLA